MATAREVCTKALKLSGAVAGIQVPTAGEIELALDEMNSLIAGWAIESWWNPSQVQKSFTPSTISSTITIGNGVVPANITDTPPFRIDCIYIQDNNTYYKIMENTRTNIGPTDLTGMATQFSYQRTNATDGVVTLNITPDKLYTYKLIYDSTIPTYTLDDEVLLPPAHVSAIEWNLAVVLGIHFGRPDQNVANIAEARFHRIKMAQIKTVETMYDYMGYSSDNATSSYNIYTDRF